MVKIPVPDPIPQLEIELSHIPAFRLNQQQFARLFSRPKLSG